MSDCRCSGAPGQNDTWDYHSDYCPVYMQGRIAELEAEAEINHKLIGRQSDLLTGVANALRGEPDELRLHSHHDLPERAAELRAHSELLREALTSISTALGVYGVRWCREVAKEALQEKGE